MDKKLFYMLLFAAATGLCSGAFFEVCMTGTGKEQLMQLLSVFFSSDGSGLSFLASFWQNLRSGLFFLLLCFVSPAVVILLPLDVFFLFCRGLFLGFSAAMVLETFGLSGMGYLLLTLAPAGLVQIVLFSLLCALSLQEGLFRIRRRIGRRFSRTTSAGKSKNRNALRCFTGQYLYLYLAGLAVLVFTCLIQAGFLQAVT